MADEIILWEIKNSGYFQHLILENKIIQNLVEILDLDLSEKEIVEKLANYIKENVKIDLENEIKDFQNQDFEKQTQVLCNIEKYANDVIQNMLE